MADTIRSSVEGVIVFSNGNDSLNNPNFNLVIPDVDQTAFTKSAADNIAAQALETGIFANKNGTAVTSAIIGYSHDGSYTEEQTVTIFDIS